MSWKSLVTACVLCVLASPAFAVPALSVTKGGTVSNNYLNAAGELVWNVQVAPTNPIPTGSSPLAAELGFAVSASAPQAAVLGGASNLSTGAGDDFDTNNPGTSIFGWETTGGAATNGKPEGLQVNTGTKQVFSALGSQIYSTTGAKDYIQIRTGRPIATAANPNTTYSITVSGAYGGKGRVAEASGGTPPSTNHDAYNNVFSRTIRGGDTDLDGDVDVDDFGILFGQFPLPAGSQKWQDSDYDGNGDVNEDDFGILFGQFPLGTYTIGNGAGGGGGLSGGGVPEPASIALLGLGLLGCLGIYRRKR